MKVDIDKINIGDIFSEESHYTVKNIHPYTIDFIHRESNQTVTLSNDYIQDKLNTANQYNTTIEVGKENKKDGTPGIREIFENIHSSEVFTVVFTKQSKSKTKKAIKEEKEAQIEYAVSLINTAKKNKKSMAEAYKIALEYIQNNAVLEEIPGEVRTLKGYKLQFTSRDGKYKCMDMEIKRTDKESGERFVNINTISELIVRGIRYIVK